MKKRTIVYIDGFNLYYRLLRCEPAYKWLDLWKLAEALVSPLNQIVAVKYFTSRVTYDPKFSEDGSAFFSLSIKDFRYSW